MRYKTRMSDILNQMDLAESKKALDKKADKSGMPKGILSKVYDRGMAAWKGGHRPGTTPQQWALARVNSFITKSSGTWGGADSDLAKQVRGRAESVEEARQLKDKDTEMLVVKHGKVIVIDKSDWDKYKSKGYKMAESYESFIDEALEVKYDKTKQGWFDKQGRRRYLGIAATNAIMKKKIDLAIKTGDWTTFDLKKEEVQFNLEELVEAKMQVQNLKTLSHRTAFRATIKKVLPNVDAFGSDSNPDFLTFKGSKSDLERLATMAKQYKVGPIRENLEEETIKEYKKMTVTFTSSTDMSKASTDLAKYNFTVNTKGMVMKVDGKGAELNAIGTDLQNFYGAKVVAENFDEACWDSHKQVGTKMKGGKRVPNCVPKNEADNDGHTKSLAKDKDTGEPKKYVSGLSDKDKDAHKKHLDKNNDKADDDKSAYKQSPADKKAKTKPSKHTKKFKQMYGEVKQVEEKFTKKDFKNNENDNEHGLNAKKVVDMFGTSAEKMKIDAINARHNMRGDISREDQRTRDSLVSKYYNKLKEETINEFTTAQIKTLEREYAPLKGKTMSGEQIKKMTGILKKYDKSMLQKLANASIPMLTTGAKSELVINRGMKWTDFKESLKVEDVEEVSKLTAEVEKLKKEKEELEKKAATASQDKSAPIPNPDTGEVPLKVGLAQAILKLKKDARKADDKQKMNSKKIMDMAKEHFMMEDIGDQAKALGLDYMNFGRYGKGGEVTHKSVGGKLQKLKKGDDEKSDKKSKDSDEPTDATDDNIKAKNLLKDFEDDFDFDDEDSFNDAIKKAKEDGLDDLADDLEGVASKVMEMDYDEAQAEFQDLKSSLSGKPVKSVEFSKKADEAIEIFTGTPGNYGIEKGNPYVGENIKTAAKDLGNTFKVIQKMVDSDETEGSAGSGMENDKKGFRPEVINTLQSLEDVSTKIEEMKDEIEDEEIKGILSNIQDEIEFVTDENADHDNYTKPHKINGTIETISELIKSIKPKRPKTKKESFIKEDENEILSFKDLKKKIDIKDIQKILPDKKKKEVKLSKEKTKIEVDPKVNISPSAGGDPKPSE